MPFFAAALPFIPAIASGVGSILGMGAAKRAGNDARAAGIRADAQSAAAREEANRYLEQIPGIARGELNPYITRGTAAQEAALEQYNRMSANPMDYINQIIAGYKPSEGYKFREGQALDAARNAAAQGGLVGTRYDQQQRAALVNGLLGEDMQQWLGNVMGAQGVGLAGQQHVADTGFGASSDLANILASSLSERAGLGRVREQEANADRRQAMADLNASRGGFAGGLGGLIGSLGGLAGQLGGMLGGGANAPVSGAGASIPVSRNGMLPQTRGSLNRAAASYPGPYNPYGGRR